MNTLKREQLSEPVNSSSGRMFQQMLDKHLLGMIWHWEGGDEMIQVLYVYEVEETKRIFRGIEGKSYLNNFFMAHTNFHMYYYVICHPEATNNNMKLKCGKK